MGTLSMDLGHALLAIAAVVVPLLVSWKLLAWSLAHHRRPKKKAEAPAPVHRIVEPPGSDDNAAPHDRRPTP